jgi:hypothetical protein
LDHAGQRVVRNEDIEICTCWHHSVGSIEREMEANAALIAAAPALYEALATTAGNIRSLGPAGALAPTFECYRPWLEMVEAALAAAQGES